MQIGTMTQKSIVQAVDRLFSEYAVKIEDAYRNTSGPFTITFRAKITPAPEGRNDIVTGIAFVAEKFRDEVRIQVDEKQLNMFEQE